MAREQLMELKEKALKENNQELLRQVNLQLACETLDD